MITPHESFAPVMFTDRDIQLKRTICKLLNLVDFFRHVVAESVCDLGVTSDEVEFHDDLPKVGVYAQLLGESFHANRCC
jgi:1,4-dihydroxy-2-naphthoyl-CoA synthase